MPSSLFFLTMVSIFFDDLTTNVRFNPSHCVRSWVMVQQEVRERRWGAKEVCTSTLTIFLQISDCNTLWHTVPHSSCHTLQHSASHCNTAQRCAWTSWSYHEYAAVILGNTLHHTTTHCNTMQLTATLQHTAPGDIGDHITNDQRQKHTWCKYRQTISVAHVHNWCLTHEKVVPRTWTMHVTHSRGVEWGYYQYRLVDLEISNLERAVGFHHVWFKKETWGWEEWIILEIFFGWKIALMWAGGIYCE